jgi:predicted O-methyltransferase YrrM
MRIRSLARVARSTAAILREPPYVAPGHFYSPLPSRAEVDRAIQEQRQSAPGVNLNEPGQLELAMRLAPMWAETPCDGRYNTGSANQMYPLSDAAVYSSLIRLLQPSRVLEIGSGYSSAIALDTTDRWNLPTKFTFIEPYPERLLGLLTEADRKHVTLRREPVQDTPMRFFEELDAGDVLFIDSTHVAKAGSDVVRLVLDVLPRLAQGVVVHFHDVFWPFEYPNPWLKERRGWTEDYLLHAFLAFNETYRVLLFNDWLWRRHPEVPREHLPVAKDERPGGLWLRRERYPVIASTSPGSGRREGPRVPPARRPDGLP